jgi:hypothetical protein
MNAQSAARARAWNSRRAVPKVHVKCDYKNCQQPRKAKGLCAKHYARMTAGTLKADATSKLVAGGEDVIKSLSTRPGDRPCGTCGCPLAYGNCGICHPIHSFVPSAVLFVATGDEIYFGSLWAKPKKPRKRARYPYSGRSIPKEQW